MRRILATVAIVVLACAAGCTSRSDNSGATEVNQVTGDRCEAGGAIRVRRFADTRVTVDGEWPKWTSDLRVLTLTRRDEWSKIRDYLPRDTVEKDLSMTVDMAHDSDYWYVRVDVTDDNAVEAPANYPPHSGDCLELFFAGAEIDSRRDIHDLINRSPEQRAFFQLQMFYRAGRLEAEFSPWRTDAEFRSRVRDDHGFRVESSRRWLAEIRIPFNAFDDGVVKDTKTNTIRNDHVTKVGIDYVDYDEKIAPLSPEPSLTNHFGFQPHNVFAPDPEEKMLNQPQCMRTLTFQP